MGEARKSWNDIYWKQSVTHSPQEEGACHATKSGGGGLGKQEGQSEHRGSEDPGDNYDFSRKEWGVAGWAGVRLSNSDHLSRF